ncbi:MAG TPA: hypothetical protein IAC12_07050 [Candidatus Aphodovivens avistercoris]|nr:hypothetical protein [Candidatus Aphodovivens avistercoris]
MRIRPCTARDAASTARLFFEAVHESCAGDYTPAQLDAWAPAAQLAADGPRDEDRILEIGRAWEEHRPADDAARQELVDLLLTWSERVLATCR